MQSSKLRPLYHLTKLNNARTNVVDATVTNETKQLKSWKEIPGPPRLPIIGQIHHFFPGGELHNLNGEQLGSHLYKKYGPIVKFDATSGRDPMIFLFDPEASAQTSNTITGTLFLLANNQEKQDQLREEIRSIPDYNEKRPYLKACLKEALRMMPVTFANARLAQKEYELLGYKIPPGIRFILMHQCMSMMEDQFPRAKEYLPERWLVNKDDPLYYGNANAFAFQPFGFGVRSCIGRRIAELEMETFLARLIENFKIEWHGPPVNCKLSSAVNYVKGPYNFIFKDA